MRARIAEAVAQAGAYPVAERTLALLAEAALMPSPEPPGYRVVDRTGAPRQVAATDGATVPMDLPALLAEFRERHPTLFRPVPASEPEREPEPVPTEDFRTATARFVETQSVLARSLMARSASRGRALATSVSDRLATLRRSRAEASPAVPGAAVEPAEPTRAGLAAGRVREGAQRVGGYARGRLADSASRLGEVARDRNVLRDALSRRALPIGLGAAALAALLAVLGGRTPQETAPAETGAPPAQTRPQVPSATPPPSAPDMSPAAPEEPPPKQASANEISGPVEVIDTATLRVGGKLVRLFGVEWVRGGQADELTRYLAGRTVTCQPVAGSEARLCSVDGRDLSEVVLFNGGGRASPEATPDLVAAEDHARAERLGVWSR
ncbi:thermonuclease family protein [Methylobacterium sp. M6A4_1b]